MNPAPMSTLEIWDAPTATLYERLSWLNAQTVESVEYDNEYWDIVCTLMVREEDE